MANFGLKIQVLYVDEGLRALKYEIKAFISSDGFVIYSYSKPEIYSKDNGCPVNGIELWGRNKASDNEFSDSNCFDTEESREKFIKSMKNALKEWAKNDFKWN